MEVTWIMQAASYIQLLPPLVAVLNRRLVAPARRWVVFWCLVMAFEDAVFVLVAQRWGTNLFVAYIFMPVTGGIALWTFSLWQTGATARLAMRLAIPPFVAVSVALTLLADDPRTFSLFTSPFYAVIMLIAASWTFVRRSLAGGEALLEQDWFWVLAGIMVYFGAFTAIPPLLSYLYALGRDDLIATAIDIRAAMTILAFLAISGGMLCPVRPTLSGGFSSPRSSPSASW